LRTVLAWFALAGVIAAPVVLAARSDLLAWRDPVYIAAGFAGVIAMTLLLVQPLLAGGLLPGMSMLRSRRIHRATGALLVLAVLIHVAGLWITSPPDVIDALLFRSPTPFSAWGVVECGPFLPRPLWRCCAAGSRHGHGASATAALPGSSSRAASSTRF
jgi:hypothetical protein